MKYKHCLLLNNELYDLKIDLDAFDDIINPEQDVGNLEKALLIMLERIQHYYPKTLFRDKRSTLLCCGITLWKMKNRILLTRDNKRIRVEQKKTKHQIDNSTLILTLL